jgi:hypothetical protein
MKTCKFTARIEAGNGGGAGVHFPYDVEKKFGTRGAVPVQATFNGVPYTGSLMKCGPSQHMLGILKAIREQIGKQPGDMVEVEVRPDAGQRVVEIPEDLAKLMKTEKLLATFEKLSYTNRREYCRWITGAKRAETRANRLEKAVELLREGITTLGLG